MNLSFSRATVLFTTLALAAQLLAAPVALADDAAPVDPAAARDAYERERIIFQDMLAISVSRYSATASTFSIPLRGKPPMELSMPDYYEVIGRPDYADSYRTRRNIRWGLLGGGTAVSIAGVVWMVHGSGIDCGSGTSVTGASGDYATYSACLKTKSDKNSQNFVVGGVVMGVGLVAMMVGLFINPNPVEPSVSRYLGDEYNKALRQKYGIQGNGALHLKSREEDKAVKNLTFGVMPGDGGAYASVGGQF